MNRKRQASAGQGISSGFTLLEIVLALAILAGALAALGEVLSLARTNASATQDETRGSLLAASVLAELVAGTREAAAVDRAPLPVEGEPPWVHTVEILPTDINELLHVRVTVEQQLPEQQRPMRVSLSRWVLHPDFVAARTEASEAPADEDQ